MIRARPFILIAAAATLLVAGAVASVWSVRSTLYFGPDPEPREYLHEYAQLAIESNGLADRALENGWSHVEQSVEILLDAASELETRRARELPSIWELREAAFDDRERLQDARGSLLALHAIAQDLGLQDSLDRLRASRAAVQTRVDPLDPADTSTDVLSLIALLSAVFINHIERLEFDEAVRVFESQCDLGAALAAAPNGSSQLNASLCNRWLRDELEAARSENLLPRTCVPAVLRGLERIDPAPPEVILRGELLAQSHILAATLDRGVTTKPASLGHNLPALQALYEAGIGIAALPMADRRRRVAEPRVSAKADPSRPILAIVALAPEIIIQHDLTMRIDAIAYRLQLAVEAYHAGRGEYPADLEQLVPHFFTEIPRDPCDAEGLVYQVVRSSPAEAAMDYVLYLKGFDGVDNHGRGSEIASLAEIYLGPGEPLFDYVFHPRPDRSDLLRSQ